jgi:hypothetical protein
LLDIQILIFVKDLSKDTQMSGVGGIFKVSKALPNQKYSMEMVKGLSHIIMEDAGKVFSSHHMTSTGRLAASLGSVA